MPKGNRKTRDNGRPRRPAKRRRFAVTPQERRRLIERLVQEQGDKLRPWTDEDRREMIKLGKELFPTPGELEQFVKGIYERRRQGRGR